MGLSRSAFGSALCSCLAHSAALGLAAALVVSPPQSPSHLVKITLFQRAVPLLAGDSGDPGKGTLAPVVEKMPLFVLPPQARPKPKLAAKPQSVARKPPQPAAINSPTPVDTPQQVALLTAPALTETASDGTKAGLGGGNTVAGSDDGEGGGSEGKTGVGVGSGSGHGGGGGVSARPDYSVNPKPLYPLIARRLGAQGVVVLRVQVREDGSVAAVELARSSGFALLDDSATRTVRASWRFLPARINGTPVASWVEVPIRFVLEDS